MKSRTTHNPFTLIELVVAMAIMIVVALIIATAGHTFYNAYSRSLKASKKLKMYMAIDRIWDTGVRNMVPFRWKDDENVSRFIFEGTENTLLFTALRRAHGDDPNGLIFIKLEVENSRLIAYSSFYPMRFWLEDEVTDQKIEKEIIAEQVKEITFEYAEAGSEEGEIEWLESWEEEEHAAIPLAVRMKVEWLDGTVEYWLRRTAGVDAKSTFGYRETVTDNISSVTSRNTGQGR
ncbi:MAG: prepilin-type N-terminal cleavage/methylation domain-containing protein [Lentisphaeria bacterium]|nr:prepilin-type N-terminal cleavage/methylation domain-containing protein [Lentisphaeria bacterium]